MPLPRNALYAPDQVLPDPNNPLAGNYTLADAADWHRQNAADTWQAIQNPQTWQDAADQYRSALLMGSTAPGAKGLGLDAAAMNVLRDMTPGAKTATMDNPAFAKWFGRSKITDTEGNPLVVYHGTPGDIQSFDPSKAGAFGDRFADAVFFTSDPGVASGYAVRYKNSPEWQQAADAAHQALTAWGKSAAEDGVGSTRFNELKAVKTAAMAKLSAVQDKLDNFHSPSEGANVVPAYLSMENPHVVDAGGKHYSEVHPQAIADATAAGKDGVIVRNVRDYATTNTAHPSDVYIAFSPTQIKSAIGNSGKFDPKDPRITAGIAGLMAGGGAAASGQPQQ